MTRLKTNAEALRTAARALYLTAASTAGDDAKRRLEDHYVEVLARIAEIERTEGGNG